MRVGIVTVTYNSAAALRDMWTLIPGGDITWLVVDNNSSDDSVECAKRLGAEVHGLAVNAGFAAANNAGARLLLDHDVLVFANPDVSITRAQAQELAMHSLSHGGLAAPQLRNPDGSLQPNGRGLPTLWNKIWHRLAPSKGSYRIYSTGACTPVSWCMGALIALPTVQFTSIGGWNEKYFLYYEDAEICLRARSKGLPVMLCGDVYASHAWARDTLKMSWAPWRRELASALRFYSRYPWLLLPLKSKD